MFIKIRRLKEKIKQASFNCQSMELATEKEWKELSLNDKYNKEREALEKLRKELSELES